MMTQQIAINFETSLKWTKNHIDAICLKNMQQFPIIDQSAVKSIAPNKDLWDFWPVLDQDSNVLIVAGSELWMSLSAPLFDDPTKCHNAARIQWLSRADGQWMVCGYVLPDGYNPGSREWSGSAFYHAKTNSIDLYFTATGRAGETLLTYEQRMFHLRATLSMDNNFPTLVNYADPQPLCVNDGSIYVDVYQDPGLSNRVNGFRDPFWFRAPASSKEYILFVGSLASADYPANGVVGLAEKNASNTYTLMQPIIRGDGVVCEMERPHVIIHNGLYYLFWSCRHTIFSANGPAGPSGLYGAVSSSLTNSFEFLNGTGLVAANPTAEPNQAYSWHVLQNLSVVSHVEYFGMCGRSLSADRTLNRANYGGTIAPTARLILNKTSAVVDLSC